MSPTRKAAAIGLATATLALSAGAAAAQTDASALADLQNTEGQPVGSVEAIPGPNGTLFKVLLDGLPPGEHGFHLHETGSCAPDFSAAGSHIAAEGEEHGFLHEDGPHSGDLPNVIVGEDGTATAQFFSDRVMLQAGGGPELRAGDTPLLMDGDGTAVIVHENADTYGEEAGAGDRIACGVIETRG